MWSIILVAGADILLVSVSSASGNLEVVQLIIVRALRHDPRVEDSIVERVYQLEYWIVK